VLGARWIAGSVPIGMVQTAQDSDAFHTTCLLPDQVTPRHSVRDCLADALMWALAVEVGDV